MCSSCRTTRLTESLFYCVQQTNKNFTNEKNKKRETTKNTENSIDSPVNNLTKENLENKLINIPSVGITYSHTQLKSGFDVSI